MPYTWNNFSNIKFGYFLRIQKNIFSRDELEISFDDVATIGAYVILSKEIPKEAEAEAKEAEEEAKTVEVTIEDE